MHGAEPAPRHPLLLLPQATLRLVRAPPTAPPARPAAFRRRRAPPPAPAGEAWQLELALLARGQHWSVLIFGCRLLGCLSTAGTCLPTMLRLNSMRMLAHYAYPPNCPFPRSPRHAARAAPSLLWRVARSATPASPASSATQPAPLTARPAGRGGTRWPLRAMWDPRCVCSARVAPTRQPMPPTTSARGEAGWLKLDVREWAGHGGRLQCQLLNTLSTCKPLNCHPHLTR